MIRIPATDGRAGRLPLEVLRDMTTLSVRAGLAHRWRHTNTDVLSTPEAVACSHSHWRCWRWLAEEAPTDVHAVLILEDDYCFVDAGTTSPPSLMQTLAAHGLDRYLRDEDQWDYIQIGWMRIPWVGRLFLDEHAHGVVPFPSDAHHYIYGSHAYLLSRSGAQRLLQVGVPFQFHVDMFLEIVAELGLTRGRLLVPPCVEQCAKVGAMTPRLMDSDIPHFDMRACSYKFWLPDASIEHTAATLGWVTLALWLAVVLTR